MSRRTVVAWAAVLVGAALPASDAFAAVPAVAVRAGPARPPQSGARDSAATVGPLAIGADVRDATGAEIGHVTRLTTDKEGRSIVQVRDNEDVYSIPLQQLSARHGVAVSNITLEALKHGWKPR